MKMFVFFLVFLFAGCGPKPLGRTSPDFTKTKPLESDVAGEYVPTAEALKYIREVGHYPDAEMSIILSKDGDFQFKNIPDWWNTFGKSHKKFDSGSGKWWISKYESDPWYRIGLNFTSTEGFNSQTYSERGLTTKIHLVGERSPYLLHLIVGDPDSDNAMQFQKKSD
jgi:hypothetical protein